MPSSNIFSRRTSESASESATTARKRLNEMSSDSPKPPTESATAIPPQNTGAVSRMTRSVLSAKFNLSGATIESDDEVEIFGSFEGKMTCHNLIVQVGAKVSGEITFVNAEVHGVLEGAIRGETARFFGGPDDRDGLAPHDGVGARMGSHAVDERRDAVAAHRQEAPGAVERRRVAGRREGGPVELGRREGALRRRVGDEVAGGLVAEGRDVLELLASPVAHRLGGVAGEVAEEREGRRRIPFLAHEQHRHLRQQQVDGRDRRHGLGRGEGIEAVAEGAVADLVVVLQERSRTPSGGRSRLEGSPRGAAFAERAIGSPLIDEAFRQAARPSLSAESVEVVRRNRTRRSRRSGSDVQHVMARRRSTARS